MHGVLKMRDTKRDEDAMKSLLVQIIKYSICIQIARNCRTVWGSECKDEIDNFRNIDKTSLTVRDDMTVNQQHQYHECIPTQRTFKKIKITANGSGAHLKRQQFQKLKMILGYWCVWRRRHVTDDVFYNTL